MALLDSLLNAKQGHVHLIGVCGVGMAGLAFHLKRRGFHVTGCDISCNHPASWLEGHGIPVSRGHDPAHVSGVDWVIRTTAVSELHPEITAAVASGIPVFRRGVVLPALLSRYMSVLVSGTHGKTTTTSMIVQVLRGCGLSPFFCVGGESAVLGGVAGIGTSDIMVVEADESDGTLAYYEPDIAVITNIEFEHAERFENIEALRDCFADMARKAKRRLIFCVDDPQARHVCQGSEKAFSYGLSSSADLRATHVTETDNSMKFRVGLHGEELGEVSLAVTGHHNVFNALAACAVALELETDFSNIQKALNGFEPVRRRFERVVEKDELVVISDYAHHPTEVSALIHSTTLLDRSRWLAVFQPHRYTRTRALGKDFPPAFEGVNELILAPVYAASEEPVSGGTSWDLYALFRRAGRTKTICASSLTQIWSYLQVTLQRGDGLLIAGAGDVEKIAEWARTRFVSGKLHHLNSITQWIEALKQMGLTATTIHAREPLAPKTTLNVGGCADILLNVGCEDDLVRVFKWIALHEVPVTILGAGSNVLVSDLGVRGVVLCLDGAEFRSIREDTDNRVIVGSGVALTKLMIWLADRGKSGLEFLQGIPGTVGGALVMNAGAWGEAIGEHIAWVRVLNPDGSAQVLEKQALRFAYRECTALRNRTILEAALEIEKDDPTAIRDRMNVIADRRAWMRTLRSAGSVFKNPEEDYAGRLIEQAGFKGFQIGGARVSDRHANMIMTEQGANASDVAALIEIIRSGVKTRFAVELTTEIVCLE